MTTASTLELLSRAVSAGLPVWLGYVDAQGSGSQRVVRPVSLVGGFLQGYDERRGENSTFAVHRITSVALVEEDAGARRPDAPDRGHTPAQDGVRPRLRAATDPGRAVLPFRAPPAPSGGASG